MNTRELNKEEYEKIEILKNNNIYFELLFLTDVGLKKSILDATKPIVKLLKKTKIHDYDKQKQGADHKVMLTGIILTANTSVETKVSLYRPEAKSGDPRFWPGRFKNFVSPDQVCAVFVANENIVILNLSDDQPLDVSDGSSFSEILLNIENDDFPVTGISNEITEVELNNSSEIDEPSRFEVISYGWDSDVEGLVKRLNRGDIKLPDFQREFVWNSTEQSRFIESLILGLPVPNIFLAKDGISKTLNIIDGQQRLKTLKRYLSGDFAISNSKIIHEDLRGRYFNKEVAKNSKSKVLEEADARTLSDSILHSIVISHDPSSNSLEYGFEYDNAVIQIFRRLNTSGKPLQRQEVRSCIFYGPLNDLLHRLNKYKSWRSMFGAEHNRYKDVEIILRFIALYENLKAYKAPMPRFLDRYMEINRNMKDKKLQEIEKIFQSTIDLLLNSCDSSLFKKGATFLLSKFEAVTVGLANSLNSGNAFDEKVVEDKIEQLLMDPEYILSTEQFINDTENVLKRINIAIKIFSR